MPFTVNDPGHVAEHNRLQEAIPVGFVPVPADSPAFTGSPTAPTPPVGDSSARVATTAFVQNGFGGTRWAVQHSPIFGQRAVTNPDLYYGSAPQSFLTLVTPDGGGNVTHPSVLFFPEGWNGFKYWMAATPYNGNDDQIENPCLWQSQDGIIWQVPVGLSNPLDPAPGSSVGYNSDTQLVIGPDNKLYLFWRTFATHEYIYVRTSSDGVTWTPKQLVWQNDETMHRPVSPAIFWDGYQWVLYAVDIVTTTYTCIRSTAPAATGPWATPTAIALPMDSGRMPWHLDGHFINGEVHLLVVEGDSGGGGLYLFTSGDGVNFTRGSEQIIPSIGINYNINYRSCFVPALVDGQFGYEIFAGVIGTAVNGRTASGWNVARTVAKRINDPLTRARDYGLAIASSVSHVAPYKVGDAFNRADAASLGTSDSGSTWTVWAGTPGISSHQAYASVAGNTKAAIDTTISDMFTEISINALGGQAWLIFRGTDTNNYWRAGYSSTTTGLQIQKIVSGSAATVASMLSYKFWISGDRIAVRASGATITVLRNGIEVMQVSDSFNQTATLIGFQTTDTTTRFGPVYARSLVSGM